MVGWSVARPVVSGQRIACRRPLPRRRVRRNTQTQQQRLDLEHRKSAPAVQREELRLSIELTLCAFVSRALYPWPGDVYVSPEISQALAERQTIMDGQAARLARSHGTNIDRFQLKQRRSNTGATFGSVRRS